MNLSADLISQFAKITNDKNEQKPEEVILYGQIVQFGDAFCVKLDGSDEVTPAVTTSEIKVGDRVSAVIKNHTAIITGNFSDPSSGKDRVADVVTLANSANKKADRALGIAQSMSLPDYIKSTYIDEVEIHSPTIKGNVIGVYGTFQTYGLWDDKETATGYIGSVKGSKEDGTETYGVALSYAWDPNSHAVSDNYVIVTDGGVRMQAGDNRLVVTPNSINLSTGTGKIAYYNDEEIATLEDVAAVEKIATTARTAALSAVSNASKANTKAEEAAKDALAAKDDAYVAETVANSAQTTASDARNYATAAYNIASSISVPDYIKETYIDEVEIRSPTIKGNVIGVYGTFQTYGIANEGEDPIVTGYMGSVKGLKDDNETETYGVALAHAWNSDTQQISGNYVIVTDGGVRMQAGDNRVVVTPNSINLSTGEGKKAYYNDVEINANVYSSITITPVWG